ncbi:girdin-like [Battus philenor]|uniref:girdin-like n=1 Tax=Battus philenor TaxID=42288 RepID=UPI0035D08FEF
MLRAAVAALACLSVARASPSDAHGLRLYAQNSYNSKDLNSVLASIEERLRLLDTISTAQAKQARRLDVIQDKLDRVETTLSLRLERAQLAAERLEHRLHMLQTNVQASIKESSEKIESSQIKIAEIAQNLTNHINLHTHLLEKVSGAYAETWHRGLVLEALMRDGLALVNVTRRELADGLRALARRQRDARLTSADLEAAFSRRLHDNTYKIDLKMQEVLDTQKRFMDSCQRVQLDDPTHVADVLDRLIDSLINKTAATFHELQTIQVTMRNHDNKIMKLLNNGRSLQTEAGCRRLESLFRNASHTTIKENELQQLTEKFVGLTNRADAALQRLEAQLGFESNEPSPSTSEVKAEADRLLLHLNAIKNEEISDEDDDWEESDQDNNFFDDGGGGDIMNEDKLILNSALEKNKQTQSVTVRPIHRRHLRKHPYDRGPSWKNSPTSHV